MTVTAITAEQREALVAAAETMRDTLNVLKAGEDRDGHRAYGNAWYRVADATGVILAALVPDYRHERVWVMWRDGGFGDLRAVLDAEAAERAAALTDARAADQQAYYRHVAAAVDAIAEEEERELLRG